jgi:protein-tyrosine phosphatase
MTESILVVCLGNICRSPVGERLLRVRLPDFRVGSAGISAMVGQGAEAQSAETALRHGLSLDGHVARQFTPDLGAAHDLILVMEPGHMLHLARYSPQLEGRCRLYDHWTGARGIADPYRRPAPFHDRIFARLEEAADAWAAHLGGGPATG